MQQLRSLTQSLARVAGVAALLASTVMPAASLAAPPTEMGTADTTPRTAMEEAVQLLAEPVSRRLAVRSHDGSFDLWLVTRATLDQVTEQMRVAATSKRQLAGQFSLDRWTYVEPDHSYVVDILGASQPYKIRLTKHLQGALIEMVGAGESADAPRWSPPWRPQPLVFLHGPMK
jgi:hypothetical protein